MIKKVNHGWKPEGLFGCQGLCRKFHGVKRGNWFTLLLPSLQGPPCKISSRPLSCWAPPSQQWALSHLSSASRFPAPGGPVSRSSTHEIHFFFQDHFPLLIAFQGFLTFPFLLQTRSFPLEPLLLLRVCVITTAENYSLTSIVCHYYYYYYLPI